MEGGYTAMLPRELREKIVTPKSDPLAKMRKDGGGSTGNTVRGKESGGASEKCTGHVVCRASRMIVRTRAHVVERDSIARR